MHCMAQHAYVVHGMGPVMHLAETGVDNGAGHYSVDAILPGILSSIVIFL